jgi:hypothetical protein
MRARTRRRTRARPSLVEAALGALAALGCLVFAGGCRVDRAKFERRVFHCDPGAPGQTCGTDESDRPMACFAASQIGGADFCARTCDPDPDGGVAPLTGPGAGDGTAACLKSSNDKPHVELQTCKPSDDTDVAPTAACGSPDLGCYRTDLVNDEGVCTTMSPCMQDEDCINPIRSVCASSFLETVVYPDSRDVHLDHLFCLQTDCKSRGSSCAAGESCLQDVVPASTNPPDICVPNCDSNLDCPPNFLCYRRVSTGVTPKVCIPGLLGFTCLDDMDCMVGRCENTGIGYKVCTTRCQADADCRQFDGIQGLFLCVKNTAQPDDPGYCRTPNSFRGSDCSEDKDCLNRNPKEVCARFAPGDALGTCLLPCDPDGGCTQRGGIEHTCLLASGARNVCFPGYFGFPCQTDGNCVDGANDLSCLPTIPGAPSICTKKCTEDSDCATDRWMKGNSWCSQAIGTCQQLLDDGSPCPGPTACKSGVCTSSRCVSASGAGG